MGTDPCNAKTRKRIKRRGVVPTDLNSFVFYHPEKPTGSPEKLSFALWEQMHKAWGNKGPELRLLTRDHKLKAAYPEAFLPEDELKDHLDGGLFYFPVSPSVGPNHKTRLMLKLKGLGARMACDYHGNFLWDLRTYLWDKELGMAFYTLPSSIFAPMLLNWHELIVMHSTGLKRQVGSLYDLKSRMVVLPNAIERDLLERKGESIQKIELDGEHNIFFHGRHSHIKGIDLLLSAMASLPPQYKKGLHLYLGGKGPSTGDLKRTASELGLQDKVHFLGYLPNESLLAHMRSADLCVYPSWFDNFPVALLEALAVAKGPVLMSDRIGCLEDLGPGLEPNVFHMTPGSLRKRLIQALSGELDPKETVKHQYTVADKFTWDKVIGQYLHLFQNIK